MNGFGVEGEREGGREGVLRVKEGGMDRIG